MTEGQKKSETALREEGVLRFWQEDNTFQKSLDKSAPNGEFVFFDGPPFATGLPHQGSLLGSTIKDVVGRYATMKGYRVPRIWGWDCHGLPIESLVEKTLGLKTKKDILDLGIEKFNQKAREMVLQFVRDWEEYITRLGRWVDFKNSYKTMDNNYIEAVWWGIKQLHQKGFLYEGNKVLMYCTHCETPLAKAEIQMDDTYKDITEEAVTIKFKIKNPEQHGLPGNTYLLAWTTTPWTLPGNVALAVGADISYALVRQDYGSGKVAHVIIAKDLIAKVTTAGSSVEREMIGKELAGITYEPLFAVPAVEKHTGKKHEVVLGDFVTTTDGTGIVHTAVMYGENDFKLGQAHGLPMVQMLDQAGHYNNEAPELVRGMFIKKGAKYVLEDLEKRNLLFSREPHTHSYPHCYRCGTALIYNAVGSWFVNIQEVKQNLLKENEFVTWVPEHLKHGRFKHILENAPDWTISRNRFWASPLPIWKCGECSSLRVVGSIDELKKSAKQAVPEDLDLHRPHIDAFTLTCDCGGTMKRISEVVDCWLESGSMPFAQHHVLGEEIAEPKIADFVAEYIAQTRTWFYYMHALGVTLFNRRAFNAVISTGNILAGDGSKMSKSKGNYTDPLVNIDTYGADAFRFYLMSSPVMHAEDFSFRDDDIKEPYSRVVNTLWNSYQFYALFKDSCAHEMSPYDSQHVLDRWILARLKEVQQEASRAMEAYDLPRTCTWIKEFIEDYSTWYVRRSRERTKGGGEDTGFALATQRHVLLTLSKLMAPITPFISESVFQGVTGKKQSVHLETWPGVQKEISDDERSLVISMANVRRVVSLALEKRSVAGIKVRQPLSRLTTGKDVPPFSEELLSLIKDEVNVKEVLQTYEQTDGSTDEKGLTYKVFSVELDAALTPELLREGYVREVVRAAQELRKQSALSPSQKVTLIYQPEGGAVTIMQSAQAELGRVAGVSSCTEGNVDATEIALGEFGSVRIAIQ